MPARVVKKVHRSGKIRALLASGLVLGVGATFTLAAWTDNEWVYGGAGPGNDTPGTKVNQMQQNTVLPPAEAKWTDEPNANGGRLDFTIEAADLFPGKTVYAPLQLRAKAGSGDLKVKLTDAMQAENPDPAVGVANSTDLYEALVYRAWVGVSATNCTAAGTKPAGTELVGSDVLGSLPLNTRGSRSFDLPAGAAGQPGEPVNICFAMTLPAGADTSLQGKKVVPLWKFTSSVGQ
ncbi:hypothetical protein [Arthrobacter sp. D1-17]